MHRLFFVVVMFSAYAGCTSIIHPCPPGLLYSLRTEAILWMALSQWNTPKEHGKKWTITPPRHKEQRLHTCTVYPKKYAHGFVVLCFVVVMQSFIMNSQGVFIFIHQGCFAGSGTIVRLPQCQWSKPDGYGKISQCITTTKHSKAKTVCIFLGIYCISWDLLQMSFVYVRGSWERAQN